MGPCNDVPGKSCWQCESLPSGHWEANEEFTKPRGDMAFLKDHSGFSVDNFLGSIVNSGKQLVSCCTCPSKR